MGWETRSGRQYYYQKERVGDKVRSVYVGRGETASLVAQLDHYRSETLSGERILLQDERHRASVQESELADYFDAVELEFQQAMTAAGYHRHKRGAWRKRRERKQE